MENVLFLGQFNEINWNDILEDLENKKGISINPDFSKWNLNTPGYLQIYKIWKDAKFNSNAIEWINYYPEDHYPTSVVDSIARFLNVIPLRSWISQINPGYFAPWHWDVDDNETEYLKLGTPIRYSCFIESPSHGHIFIIGNDYLYNQDQGNLYQWIDYKEWHSGINAGMVPKYMFHLIGIKRS